MKQRVQDLCKAVQRGIVIACTVAACVLPIGRAQAQEGPYTPWVGEKGITETVAEIMARDAITPKLPPGTIIMSDEKGEEAGELDRTGLPQDPNSPNVPYWPYLPGNDLKHRLGGGPDGFLPQTLGTEFNGPDLNSAGYIPPDTQGAVGPTQILMFGNGRIRVYSKAGVLGGLNTTADVFFNSVRNGSGVSDPQVKYDRTTGRWIVLAINVASSNNRVVLAVSSGSTITNTASFTFYQFQQNLPAPAGNTGEFADYPKAGVDANAIYVGCNMFNSTFHTTAWVIKKSSVLSGGPIEVTAFRNLVVGTGAGPYAPMGVDNDDPASTEGYIVGVDNSTGGRLVVRRVSNPGGAPSISGNLNITVPTTNNGQTQPALGSTGNLDNIDDRLSYAMMKKHRDTGAATLWTAHHIEVNTAGTASTTGNRLGSRWYEVQNLTATPSLRQSGTLFDPAASNPRGFWFPGIAMSGQGHMAISTSYAGAADRAGCAVAGRFYNDSLGTVQAVTLAEVSSTAYNVQSGTQRWGDYSNLWVDPNDDMTMWGFVEYCNSTNSWACRAIQLKAPLPATPASCSPSTVSQGASNVNVVVTGTSVSGSGFFDPFAYYANHIAAAFSGTGITINSVTYNSPTQLTLNISVSASATTGGRSLTVTNPDGQLQASAGTVLTIDASGSQCPTITINPVSQTVCSGSPVTFIIGASGNPTPTYQWRKNTTNIPGATGISYTIASTSPGDVGSYDCVATNSCGSATSTAATLTVNTAAAITSNPSSQAICSGSNVTFTVTASGSPTPTFQWRKNGSNIGGATSSSYTINGVTGTDAASYDCVATNSCGSGTSSAAILTVNTAAAITGNPSDQSACEGGSASFTVTASGSPAPTFQWRKDGNNIGGATNATLSLTGVTGADTASYDCVVTNSCGSATSTAASLTVNTGPSIGSQPANQEACEGGTAVFSVGASGTSPLSYQWQKDGFDIGGETASTLTLTNVTGSDAASYSCTISNSCGTVTSSSASLVVDTAAAFTLDPISQSICEGGTVVFSASATGTPAPTLQWTKDGIDIFGETGPSLTLTGVTAADEADYQCKATNACGTVLSAVASLTVLQPVNITTNPAGQTVPEGGTATFTVAATGSPALSYQWRKDGVDILGATSSSLVIFPVTLDDAGDYDCVVSNTCGSQDSADATLQVRCPADFDQSGFVDIDDYDAFVAAFELGDDSADFDGSGFVDIDDFDAFVHAFEEGC